MSNVVRYTLSLESRQFVRELHAARESAKDLQRSAAAADTTARAFSSTQNAMAAALGGNLPVAAKHATEALKAMVAAMSANPILAVAAALGTLAVAVVGAADRYKQFRERVREARNEAERFAETVAKMGGGSTRADRAVYRLKGDLKWGDEAAVKRAVEQNNEAVRLTRENALYRNNLLEEERAKLRPDEERVKLLEEERDAAKARYAMELDIQQRYKALIEEDKKAKAEGAAKDREAVERRRAANAEEVARLERAGAATAAELSQVVAEMSATADGKFGGGYADRLAAGQASAEEIAMRREIDQWREKATAATDRETAEARQAERARLAFVEQRAIAEGDAKALRTLAERVEKTLDAKYGKWDSSRLPTAANLGKNGLALPGELEGRQYAEKLKNQAREIEEAQRQARYAAERGQLFGAGVVGAELQSAYASGDWRKLESTANAMEAAADRKFGQVYNPFTHERRREFSPEEREMRETVQGLREEAMGMAGGEGVLAKRDMSIRDVFNSMRGMGQAKFAKAPIDHEAKTAKNTEEMVILLKKLQHSLDGEGVE